MKKSHFLVVTIASLGLFIWAELQANNAQASIVNFTSQIDPSPDILITSTSSHTYQHNLNNVGFNSTTDTLTSAEFHVYFTEEDWLKAIPDSVTIFFDDVYRGISKEPSGGFGNSSWDDSFSVDIGLLQTDGILTVTLETGGSTYYNMSELTAQADRVPIPGAVWLLGSGLIGLVGLRRKIKK